MVFCAIPRASFAETQPLPKFDEVYQLLLTNGSGLTEAELNRAAVKGLLDELQSQVVLVTNASPPATSNLLSKVSVFDNAFAYLRVAKIESGLNNSLKSAYQKLAATNKLKGVVLDLRYASGTDYAAAAKTADLFIKTEQPLLQWGEASARATAKTNAIAVPVAVLVNHQTSGAAEALAGMVREAQIGLVIGTNTAGQASVFKDFSLKNGQQLKVASAPVKLGNGKEISKKGLKPDIEIAVNAEDEKAFYENPYRTAPNLAQIATPTNNLAENDDTNKPRTRLNEAELVRMQREGVTFSSETPARPRRRLNEAELVRLQRQGLTPDQEFLDDSSQNPEPGKPVLSDPALVRALDLLKGLAVVQQSRRH